MKSMTQPKKQENEEYREIETLEEIIGRRVREHGITMSLDFYHSEGAQLATGHRSDTLYLEPKDKKKRPWYDKYDHVNLTDYFDERDIDVVYYGVNSFVANAESGGSWVSVSHTFSRNAVVAYLGDPTYGKRGITRRPLVVIGNRVLDKEEIKKLERDLEKDLKELK